MAVGIKTFHRWIGFLGAAAILSSTCVLATSSGMFESCDAPDSMGNGFCEEWANNVECGYDWGDCCTRTCDPVDENGYTCQDFVCIDPEAPCVNDDDITADMLENCGDLLHNGNSWCDYENNDAECAYDGGDCCKCTCVEDENGDGCVDFACIDPEASCVNDDDITVDLVENCERAISIGNGKCDFDLNTLECAYDGGDCCLCTCEHSFSSDAIFSSDEYYCTPATPHDCQDPTAPCYGDDSDDSDGDDESMSYDFISWEDEEPLPTVDGLVNIGTKTEVGVSATAYDTRPGASSGEVGCGEVGGNGCAPANTLDGIVIDFESRWSCPAELVDGGESCQIEYTFSEPQEVQGIYVAFYKGDKRTRTLQVYVDGELTQTHESYTESSFTVLDVRATGVTTVMLESVYLLSEEWISLLEVIILVTP